MIWHKYGISNVYWIFAQTQSMDGNFRITHCAKNSWDLQHNFWRYSLPRTPQACFKCKLIQSLWRFLFILQDSDENYNGWSLLNLSEIAFSLFLIAFYALKNVLDFLGLEKRNKVINFVTQRIAIISQKISPFHTHSSNTLPRVHNQTMHASHWIEVYAYIRYGDITNVPQ